MILPYKKTINNIVKSLNNSAIITSLFIDPDTKQIDASKQVMSDMVEIHTGKYGGLGYAEKKSDPGKETYE